PFTGRCTHFDYLGCRRWREGCGHCPSHGVYPKSLFDATHGSWKAKKRIFTSEMLGRMVLVPVSRWMEKQVAKSFLGSVERRVILNGVDTEVFRPQADSLDWNVPELTGKRILLGVSMYWNDRKGLADYCKLDAMLPSDCRIALVGLEHPIPGTRIIPLPHIASPRHLAWLYCHAALTLNLSYEESFGLTTAESLACGTPVISYDRTASPELLDSSVGLVCPAGDVTALSKAVAALLHHSPSPDTCRNYALKRFALKRQMDEYMALYEELT
ncbi:MAG: glycosyltransferase, partial [Victivallales bacterium]|nr:glycosyltransferase [Victivallales bacterium]